ncbi:MAG: PepSY domain-containing protein [Oscillospiraceae bacterium]
MHTAVDAFYTQYPNAELIGISYQQDHGVYVYKVVGMDDAFLYKINFGEENGEVIFTFSEALHQGELTCKQYRVFVMDGIVEPDVALASALQAGSGTFDEWTLEMEDGTLAYVVSFDTTEGDDYDVIVDAKTGKVLYLDD